MSTGIQSSDEVLPGYVLTERLGSGGYAEVWRAEAPGGIDKAVKIVYGHYDDELASQELKSLERIKGVRHPFLLSLERFEVVNGRLAILTELADMSLDQRRRQCRADGLPGIPREELLQYIADAAEALDFLTHRHGLQHLDIKPENLLILGDHVKVADFGLVKELAARTQNSLVAGLTPTYASPEMFDDNPSLQSDQYSLAIVYQEMLVGTLPFPGRTAAQLAKQHTQAEPQLMALPERDRPVIARALAKNPSDRFPSCRSFAEALIQIAESVPRPATIETPLSAPPTSTSEGPPAPDDTQRASLCTTQRRAPEGPGPTVTQPVRREELESPNERACRTVVEPALPVVEEVVDVPVPATEDAVSQAPPTLLVAVGGVGIQVLGRLRNVLARRKAEDADDAVFEAIALDTDRDELREACSGRWEWPLNSEDTLHLPLRLPKSYDNSREILAWMSRRWLYNIPRSLETRGYRPLGRVALVDHAPRVLALLDQKLENLKTNAGAANRAGEEPAGAIRVVLLAGMGGGTGAGMVIDLANAARAGARAREISAEVHGFLLCTCFNHAASSTLSAANTYALLTELRHTAESGNLGVLDEQGHSHPFESSSSPFDGVYCVPVRARSSGPGSADALGAVARYIALESTTSAGSVVRSCRRSPTPREQTAAQPLMLRSLGYASLADQKQELLTNLACDLASAVKERWLSVDSAYDATSRESASLPTDSGAKRSTAPGDAPSGEATPTNSDDASPASLRGRFGEHAALRFAGDLVQHVGRLTNSRDQRDRPLLSSRDAVSLVVSARDALDSISAHFIQIERTPSPPERLPALAELTSEACKQILTRAVDLFDPRQPDRVWQSNPFDELIAAECLKLLQENLARRDFSDSLMTLLEHGETMAKTIERASTDLLQCGCDRRTLIVAPLGGADSAAVDELKSQRPLATVVAADVDDVAVVCEQSGIAARSVAIGLARVYPGIEDAARRLLTRIDIDWKNLV